MTTPTEPSTNLQASVYQQLRGHLATLKLHAAAEGPRKVVLGTGVVEVGLHQVEERPGVTLLEFMGLLVDVGQKSSSPLVV